MMKLAMQTEHVVSRLCQCACSKVFVRQFTRGESSQGTPAVIEKDSPKVVQDTLMQLHVPEDQKYVEWRTKALQFCQKMKLTEKQFLAMCNKAPRMKNTEMQEHLSKVSDILSVNGYEKWTKFLINRHVIKFMNISLDCISLALEEHRNILLNDEKNQDSLENIKRSLDVNLDEKEMFDRLMIKKCGERPEFPIRRIFQKHLPYNSMTEYLSTRLGIEERVVTAVLPFDVDFGDQIKDLNMKFIYRTIERLSILQEVGASNYDILENHNLLNSNYHKDKYNDFDLLRTVEEQKNIYGKVNLNEVQKYLIPNHRHSISTMLQKLLSLKSITSFNQEDRLRLSGKSTVNAARAFFLLTDEGFETTDLQKFVYLFVVDESEIKQYIELKKGERTEKMAYLTKATRTESIIDFPDLGLDLQANSAFPELTNKEKFLQNMQLFFEFRIDDPVL